PADARPSARLCHAHRRRAHRGRRPLGTGPLAQLVAEKLVDDLRIRLSLCLLHHLADEEAEQPLLAAAVGLDLAGVAGEDAVDERLQFGSVADQRLAEIRLRAELRIAALRERAHERLTWDRRTRRDHLPQLRP